jgi:hypothetical protein
VLELSAAVAAAAASSSANESEGILLGHVL